MERRSFQTPLGEVWLWGSAEAFDGSGPVALVIRGAAAGRYSMERWPPAGCEPIFAHLPGFHCPLLRETSIEAFASAFGAVVAEHFARRVAAVVGISAGAWVAAAMSVSGAGLLLIEPFYGNDRPWLVTTIRGAMVNADATYRAWMWKILGIGEVAFEARCFKRFMPGAGPAVAVVAEDGLASPDDRALLSQAGVLIETAKGNHDVAANDPGAFDRGWLRLRSLASVR